MPTPDFAGPIALRVYDLTRNSAVMEWFRERLREWLKTDTARDSLGDTGWDDPDGICGGLTLPEKAAWLAAIHDELSRGWEKPPTPINPWTFTSDNPDMPACARFLVFGKHAVGALRDGEESRILNALHEVENACPATAQEAAPAVPIIDAEDLQILSTLNRFHPVLKQLGDIETESKISRKTISTRVPALIQSGLVERPKGERSGIRLSPKGQDFLLNICPKTSQ